MLCIHIATNYEVSLFKELLLVLLVESKQMWNTIRKFLKEGGEGPSLEEEDGGTGAI